MALVKIEGFAGEIALFADTTHQHSTEAQTMRISAVVPVTDWRVGLLMRAAFLTPSTQNALKCSRVGGGAGVVGTHRFAFRFALVISASSNFATAAFRSVIASQIMSRHSC